MRRLPEWSPGGRGWRMLAMREKRAPDTAPVPLRGDAGSRRARSVESERLVQAAEMTKASVGLVAAGARMRGKALARSRPRRRLLLGGCASRRATPASFSARLLPPLALAGKRIAASDPQRPAARAKQGIAGRRSDAGAVDKAGARGGSGCAFSPARSGAPFDRRRRPMVPTTTPRIRVRRAIALPVL